MRSNREVLVDHFMIPNWLIAVLLFIPYYYTVVQRAGHITARPYIEPLLYTTHARSRVCTDIKSPGQGSDNNDNDLNLAINNYQMRPGCMRLA
ncbi:hypothetical protein BU24DRAFT_160375 [Aaosphaeria arxii CBS 175.79]|uniref:Uncharacterized protein n=1 Tax=Aaosphaeria arxii CBS 175.79 TaxID=1450172 RepID=A0A6A5XY29_9PLEO|nr:uncharacterized protein BU24DRAFT_160375 [Aaosphaeria arxii CBS 175.79]KAF2017833.1 hypothetical protein BU24DRAFT_160375 [Aaosphaeria arxii CBS 175.79]